MPGLSNTIVQTKTGFFHALSTVLTKSGNPIGNEKYKSAHSVRSNEIWMDDIAFAGYTETILTLDDAFQSALDEASTNPAVTVVGSTSSRAVLYPLANTDYETWFFDTGTPSTSGSGFFPSSGWVKPLIAPPSVTDEEGSPSAGYGVRLYRPTGEFIDYALSSYDVDYYSGLVKFDPNKRPIDSGNGLYFQLSQSGLETALATDFSTAKQYLIDNSAGGVVFQYTGQYLSDIDLNGGGGGTPLTVSEYLGASFSDISEIIFRGGSVTTQFGESDSVFVGPGGATGKVVVWIPAPNYEDALSIPAASFASRYVSYPTTEGNPYYAGSMGGTVDNVTRNSSLTYTLSSFGYFDDTADFEIEFIDWDESTVLDSLYFTMNDVSVGSTVSTNGGITFNLTDKSDDADRRKAAATITFGLSTLLNGTPRAGGKARIRISFTDSGGDNNDDLRVQDFFYDPDGSQSEDANFGNVSSFTITENTPSLKWLSGIAYYDTTSSFDFFIDDIDDLNDRSYPTTKQINLSTANFAITTQSNGSEADFGGWSQSYNIQNLEYEDTLSINSTSQYIPGINTTTNVLNGSGSYPYALAKLYDWSDSTPVTTTQSAYYQALIDTKDGAADFSQHPIIDESRRETLSGNPVNITSNSSFISTVSLPSDSLQMLFGRIIFPQHDLSPFYPQINITNGRDYSSSTGTSKTFAMINNSTSLSTTNVTLTGYRWFATSFTRDSGLTQDIAQGIIEFDSNITESDIHYNATLGSANATPNTVILIGMDSTGANTTADKFYWVSNNPTTYNGRTGGTLPSSINWQKGGNSVYLRRVWVVVGFTDTTAGKSKWIKNITADSFS